MAKESFKPTSSAPDLTADIDDDWALDDDAAAPSASGAEDDAAGAALESTTAAATPTGETLGSETPATEEIDSEWPEDEEAAGSLKHPIFPASAKVPNDAKEFADKATPVPHGRDSLADASSASSRPTTPATRAGKALQKTGNTPLLTEQQTPQTEVHEVEAPLPRSEPPVSAPVSSASVARFEKAASALRDDASFRAVSSNPPAPSSKPPAADPTRDSQPGVAASAQATKDRRHAEEQGKRPPFMALGLAAAAVLGIGAYAAFGGMGTTAPRIESAAGEVAKPGATQAKTPAAAAPAANAPARADDAANAKTPREQDSAAAQDDPQANNDAQDGSQKDGEDATQGASKDGEPSDEAKDGKPSDEAKDGKPSDEAKDGKPSDEDAKGKPTAVKVNVYPPDAEIYHKGRLLARAGQTLAVEPGERKVLVLIRQGYYPRKLVLDSNTTETIVNIGLRKKPETDPSTTPGKVPNKTADVTAKTK